MGLGLGLGLGLVNNTQTIGKISCILLLDVACGDRVVHGKSAEFGNDLGISFPGNFAFGGKYLQFWGEIYHLDGYFDLFLPKISKNLLKYQIFKEMFDHI